MDPPNNVPTEPIHCPSTSTHQHSHQNQRPNPDATTTQDSILSPKKHSSNNNFPIKIESQMQKFQQQSSSHSERTPCVAKNQLQLKNALMLKNNIFKIYFDRIIRAQITKSNVTNYDPNQCQQPGEFALTQEQEVLGNFQDIYLYMYGILAFDKELYRVIIWKGVAVEKFELNLRDVKKVCVNSKTQDIYACDSDTIYSAEFKGRKSYFSKIYCFNFEQGQIDELESIDDKVFIWNKKVDEIYWCKTDVMTSSNKYIFNL